MALSVSWDFNEVIILRLWNYFLRNAECAKGDQSNYN